MTTKNYELTLTTLGPVHIGCGEKLRAKEYILLDDCREVYFPDMGKLYAALNPEQQSSFEKYLMNEGNGSEDNRNLKLNAWLRQNHITTIGDWGGYSIKNGNAQQGSSQSAKDDSTIDARADTRCEFIYQGGDFDGTRCRNQKRDGSQFCRPHANAQPAQSASAHNAAPKIPQGQIPEINKIPFSLRVNDIQAFVKDAWGKPYIPGSSLKGLLRTLYIVWKQTKIIDQVNEYHPTQNKTQGGTYSPGITSPESDIVNNPMLPTDDKDIFQFLSVSDSEPLNVDDLILCKKIDRLNRQKQTAHGQVSESTPALDRECVKPGVNISFTVSASSEEFRGFIENIDAAIKAHTQKSIASVKEKFQNWGTQSVANWDALGVYLGAGSGFHTKTVAMSNNVRANILDWKFDQHGRWTKHRLHGHGNFRPYDGPFAQPLPGTLLSDSYGWPSTFVESVKGELQSSAPRIYKLTKVYGEYYEMGKCSISVKPLL